MIGERVAKRYGLLDRDCGAQHRTGQLCWPSGAQSVELRIV